MLGSDHVCRQERLHNLTAIVDRNNIQIDGFTEEIIRSNHSRINGARLIGTSS